jgi:hypothetical protein
LTGLKVSLPRINWLQSSTGEELMNALSVTAVYSDSGIKVLSANEYTLNPAIPTETVGNNRRITVVYIDESSGIIASDKIAINVLASGTALPELVGLSLTVPRTAWAAGEVFVPTVTAAYSDSSYGTIPEGQYTLSPANPTQSVAENLIVSASYTAGGISKSGSTAIDVKAAKSEIPAISGIIATMEKRVWAKYEPFSVNVVAIYEDGTRGVVEQGYTLSPTSPTAADGHNITVRVSYRGYTAPLNIDVNTSENFSLTLSSIGAVPTKTTWLQNSPFSVVVTATYSDGSSGTISKGYSIDTESPTANVGSAIPISVSYKNQTSTFDIKVVGEVGMFAPLTRITAVPNKGVPASYMFDEDYSITVNAYYGESDEPLQVMYFTTDPVNITATTTGTVPVTVTYTENEITKTTSFNIIVNPIIIGSVNGGKTAILDLTDYVNVPEAKVNPDIEGGFNTYFTISSIVWKDGVNLQNSVFIPYTVYTAIVTLEANTGYTFYGLNADKFVHTGSTGVSNAENTGVVAIEFPRTAEAAPELTSLTVTVSGTVTGPDGVLTPAFSTGVREYTFISYATGNLKFTVNAELEDYATTSFVSPYQTGNIAPAGTELITITVVGSTASTTYTVKVMNGIADGGTLSYVQVGSKWREIHKFTASGTLSVNKVSYDNSVLVIAGGGGGGGGNWPAGGGGAGGYLETNTFNLEAKDYSVEVGAGGGGGRGSKDNNNGADGYNGNDSWFGTRSSYGKDANGLKSRGGGGGGRTYTSAGSRYGNNGHNGGSGGGSGYAGTWNSYGGAAESGQGNGGGGVSNWEDNHAGSGGGAGYGGSEVTATHGGYGNGGGGKWSDIMGSLQLYAEGGSVSNNSSSSVQGNNAAANTGSGGMGGWNSFGGSGGSGIVVVSIPIN